MAFLTSSLLFALVVADRIVVVDGSMSIRSIIPRLISLFIPLSAVPYLPPLSHSHYPQVAYPLKYRTHVTIHLALYIISSHRLS